MSRYIRFLGVLLVTVAMALTIASAQQPDQSKAQPKAATGASRIPEGATVLKDVAYGTHERQKLDLIVPKSDKPLPLIVWVHGGGWEAGSKNGGNPAIPFLSKGYAVASINYRLSQHAIFPAQIVDCKEAIRHLRSIAKANNLDPDRFGAWGASAGGHLVALLGTTDEKSFDVGPESKKFSSGVQCVCDWFGPTDFLHWGASTVNNPGDGRPNAITRLLGGPVVEKQDLAKRASPVSYCSRTSVPFLIVHGDKDNIVPLQQSEVLNDALKKCGVDSELVVIPGNGHGGTGFSAKKLADEIERFFAKHLKKSER